MMDVLKIKSFFVFLFTSCVWLGNAYASDAPHIYSQSKTRAPLQGRIEGSYRMGSKRDITLGEFWVPLAQDAVEGSVLYADYRMMGDDNSNNEFNAGVGYRQMVDNVPVLGDGVVGVHGWYDRRLTQFGSKFNQATLGAEWFSDTFDAKINGYYPFNQKNDFTRSNPNGGGDGFVGNQLVVNTDQTLREEALRGLDLEFGVRIPFLDEDTDSTRVYGGLYHFQGDQADNISGWRARFTSDINSDFQLGARFQHDHVRGSQGFLEATIRFPFGHKQSYKDQGLWSRMDESPERDIDIVSSEVVTDDGVGESLLNTTTGNAQNIIHVDNSNGGAEDGSVDNPYNTLAEAEGVAGDNDLIYIHSGLGNNTGMDSGLNINNDGQMVVGSGADLTFDGTKFGTSNGLGVSDTTLIAATTAPIITNTGGNGIDVTADNVTISGITIDGASSRGVAITNANNFTLHNLDIRSSAVHNIEAIYNDDRNHNVEIKNTNLSDNAASNGFELEVSNNTHMDLNIDGLKSINNFNVGIGILSRNNSTATYVIQNSMTDIGNGGIAFELRDDSQSKITLRNNNVYNSNSVNVAIQLYNNAVLEKGIVDGNLSDTTFGFHGILVRAKDNSLVQDIDITNNTLKNINSGALVLDSCCIGGYTSKIEKALISGNMIIDSGGHGISIGNSHSSNDFTNIEIDNNVIKNMTGNGVSLSSYGTGGMSVSLSNNTIMNNANRGVLIDDDGTATFNIDMGGGSLGSVGKNIIDGNVINDIFIDLDGGELKAENNYWGLGGFENSDVTLNNGTIDVNPELTSEPN